MSNTANLLRPEQAAERLNVKPGTLANWRSTERQPLPFVRIGAGAIRYRPEDIERFVAERLTHAA
jgi:hypothetical protein